MVSTDQISADLAGEAAILNLASGIYYSLDEIGATIWRFVQEPKTVADIEAFVLSQYDVDADRCAGDVTAPVDALHAEGLVRVTPPPE
jgi:coenzyme PQQ synthesis protein D (PqqD)